MMKKSNTQLKLILSDLFESKQQHQSHHQQQQLNNLKKKCLKSLNRFRSRYILRKRLAEIHTLSKSVNKYRISQLNNVNMLFETSSNKQDELHYDHATTNCDGCCKLNVSDSNELLQRYHKLKEFCKNLLHRYKLISDLCGSYDEFNTQFLNELTVIPQQISSTSTTSSTTNATYKAIYDCNNKSFEYSNTNKNDDDIISVNKRVQIDDIPIHPQQQQQQQQQSVVEPSTPMQKPNPYYELENRPIRTNYDARNPISIFIGKKTPHKQNDRKNTVNQSTISKNSSNNDVTIMQVSSTSLNSGSSSAFDASNEPSNNTVDAKIDIVKQKSEESLVTVASEVPPAPPEVETNFSKESEKVEVKIEETIKPDTTNKATKYNLIEPVVKPSQTNVDIPSKVKTSNKSQPEKKDDVPVVKGIKKTSKLKEPIQKSTEVHVSLDMSTTSTPTATAAATTSTTMSPTIATTAKATKAKSESSSIPQATAKPSKLPRLNTPTTHKHNKEDTQLSPSSLNTSSSSVTKLKEKSKETTSTTSTSSISGKQKTQIKRNEVREPEHHEGRPKRVKKPIDYKEKNLNSKFRRDGTTAK